MFCSGKNLGISLGSICGHVQFLHLRWIWVGSEKYLHPILAPIPDAEYLWVCDPNYYVATESMDEEVIDILTGALWIVGIGTQQPCPIGTQCSIYVKFDRLA